MAGISYNLEAHIGISQYPNHADSINELVRTAVFACHQARLNDSRYRSFDKELDDWELYRFRLLTDLGSALGDLAVHQLDMIISDHAIPAGMNVKAFSHPLGASKIAFFVQKAQARRYSSGFPKSLDAAPLLVPTSNSPVRRGLENWFEEQGLAPAIVAEFEDSALMKAFGEEGTGLFPAPRVIRAEVELMYKCRRIGELDSVQEAYYAISPERKLKHPVVLEVIETARSILFGKQG